MMASTSSSCITGIAPSFRLPPWTQNKSAMQDALSAYPSEDTISLALGVPAPELFPLKELAASTEAVLLRSGLSSLQYGPPDVRLKTQIVELMACRGIDCSENQVFLTTGAQQGLLLLGRLFLQSGDLVAAEQTVYPGFRQVVESCGASLLPIPIQSGAGPDLNALHEACTDDQLPAAYYTVPEGHNPLGISMTNETRESICEFAAQFQIPVIEDDPYGFLIYDQEVRQPLRSRQKDYILYVGSFSKIVAPGLRVGWLVVPPSLVPALAVAKESADIDCATFSQRVISDFIASGHLTGQLTRLRSDYTLRRDAMIQALDAEMPHGCSYSSPRSGVFVWVELPEGHDATRLLRSAVRNGVSFLPGDAFVTRSDCYSRRCLRLNFSSNPPDRIREGIRRLATTLRQEFD